MNQWICSSMLLYAILSTSSQAEDFCKSVCTSEKSECRVTAEQLTRDDTNPIFEMARKSPPRYIVGENRMGRSEEALDTEASNFRNRRMERIHACDDKFMRCAQACSSQKPAPNSSVILVKPETNR